MNKLFDSIGIFYNQKTLAKKVIRTSLFAVLLASASFCLSACKDKKQTISAQLPDEVKEANPIVMNVEKKGTYSTRIAANEDVEIRARAGGYLDCVKFKKGARINKGDLLFKIDDRPYKAALDAAQAKVKEVESKIELAQNNAERARGLFKKNAISKEAYQTRETELSIAKAKLLEAKAAEKNALLNLEYTNVLSPISGRISENFVDEGNLVAAHTTKLARVVDDSSVKAYFELNSADAMRYKNSNLLNSIDAQNGAQCEVILKGDSKKYIGKISYYDNVLGAGTSSLVLRADIPNSDGGLMVGSYGKIIVDEGIAKDSLLIPEEVIGTDLTGRFVLTLTNENIVRQTPVKVGIMIGNLRVIDAGITKDSRIVIEGIQRATIGRKVKPLKAEISHTSIK